MWIQLCQEHGKVAWPNILTFHGSPVGCPFLPSKVKYSAHLGHLFLSGQGFGKTLADGWWLGFFYTISDERFSDTWSILIIHLDDIRYNNMIQYDTICWFDMSMLQVTKQPSSTLDIVTSLPVELRQGKLRRLKRRPRYLRRSSSSDLMVMTVDVEWQPGLMGSNGCILHCFYHFLEGRPFPSLLSS